MDFKAWSSDRLSVSRWILLCVCLVLLLDGRAWGAAVSEVSQGPWNLYAGSTIVARDFDSEAACAAGARDRGIARDYTCRTSSRVVVSIVPDPVDCVVSEWSAWVPGEWSACSNGTQTRTETRARTILTQPANGGGACPVMTETRTVSQACGSAPSAALFTDSFEYEVSRSGTGARSVFTQHGWTHAKSTNSGDGGAWGYLFTQFEPALNSRALVIESRAGDAPIPPGFGYGQTDFYVQLGRENGAEYLPGGVWFQFTTTATTDSRFAARDKFLYPCRVFYPCGQGQWSWLLMQGSRGFQTTGTAPSDRYLAMQGETADFRGAAEYPTNATKLFQNIDPTPMLAGTWYDVRIRVDVSGEQGVYQAWRRVRGSSTWNLIADWRGGVTPNFVWPIPLAQRRGFELLRLPTTSNGPGNSTFKLDDFVIGRSAAELPN